MAQWKSRKITAPKRNRHHKTNEMPVAPVTASEIEGNILTCDLEGHGKLAAALARANTTAIAQECAEIFNDNPRTQVIFLAIGGASTGRYNYSGTFGKGYPRTGIEVTRYGARVRTTSGPYKVIGI